jgi:hypothetical protein
MASFEASVVSLLSSVKTKTVLDDTRLILQVKTCHHSPYAVYLRQSGFASRYRVSTNIILKKAVFWDVAQCRSGVNRRFGGTYRLHLQDRGDILENILPPPSRSKSEAKKPTRSRQQTEGST